MTHRPRLRHSSVGFRLTSVIVALSGVYFTASLPRRAKEAVEELGDELRYY